jgi:hypothetical protein
MTTYTHNKNSNLLRALSSLELVASHTSWFGVVDFATSWLDRGQCYTFSVCFLLGLLRVVRWIISLPHDKFPQPLRTHPWTDSGVATAPCPCSPMPLKEELVVDSVAHPVDAGDPRRPRR